VRHRTIGALLLGLSAAVIAIACSEDGTAVPPTLDGGSPIIDDRNVEDTHVTDSAQATDTALNEAAAEDAGVDAACPTACAYGCTAGACNTTCTGPTVVIDQSVADDFTLLAPWQSFEVPATGVLTALELRPNTYSADGGITEMLLSIYAGEGIGGTRLAQEDFTANSAGGAPFRAFSLTTPVPLQTGQKYTWELTGAKGLYYSNTDTYAGGRASNPARDMVFKAHVAACH
jgi:hypothetical protein